MKVPNTASRMFVCTACKEQCTSYDSLIVHVFEAHRRELLERTKRDAKLAGDEQAPALEAWIDAEIAQLDNEGEL
jgi:Fe-S oxidoreductase